ncbi:ubiquinol-cytochrome-c reductase complex assembly factor 2 [Procambarus clarkii]|uniref:ubiquinol-cytochrome-c reductase complex assembly factor 2 n=1 Tax=Procambarus clarkii TaxID=6728 RepID=UPI001E67432D|nr:ubiquinol-cytochrome-c reductase complex assembly factor 2-like [Procambarus clarkii]
MARNSYRNFLRLLDKWPVDSTKAGDRDLGKYLRLRVTEGFRHGDATAVDETECQRIYASLNRIATNVHAKQYPRTLRSTSTGLTAEECKQVISEEFLQILKEQDKGFFSGLFKRG